MLLLFTASLSFPLGHWLSWSIFGRIRRRSATPCASLFQVKHGSDVGKIGIELIILHNRVAKKQHGGLNFFQWIQNLQGKCASFFGHFIVLPFFKRLWRHSQMISKEWLRMLWWIQKTFVNCWEEVALFIFILPFWKSEPMTWNRDLWNPFDQLLRLLSSAAICFMGKSFNKNELNCNLWESFKWKEQFDQEKYFKTVLSPFRKAALNWN